MPGMALNKGKCLGTTGRFAFASLRFCHRPRPEGRGLYLRRRMPTTARDGQSRSAEAATLIHSRHLHQAAQMVVPDSHGAPGDHARDRRFSGALPGTQANPALQPGRVAPRYSSRYMSLDWSGTHRLRQEASAQGSAVPRDQDATERAYHKHRTNATVTLVTAPCNIPCRLQQVLHLRCNRAFHPAVNGGIPSMEG